MATIKPFTGLYFNLQRPEDLGKFVSPPYDMIDDAAVDELYKKDPRNVVRIIQNKPLPSDTGNQERHNRASRLFQEWVRDSTIVRDASPSMYFYQQQFESSQAGRPVTHTRTGVIALVKLVDYGEGIVSPHEYTLTAPKQDRYELLQAIRSHTELVFGIVADPGKKLFSAITGSIPSECRGYFIDADSVRHTLYHINNPDALASLTDIISDKGIIIADGHHRYETALKFFRDTKKAEHEYVMMNLVSMADPGLRIRAFHRLVRKHAETETIDLRRGLEAYFDCTNLGSASLEGVYRFLGSSDTSHEMLYFDSQSQQFFGLSLNAGGRRFIDQNPRGMSARWNGLTVSKINSIVVSELLHLPLDGKTLHDVMEYINDPKIAFNTIFASKQATGGKSGYHGVFFIRPIDIESINAIVSGKERMPQKSTNFFPKCYSGLVFHAMGDM